MIIALVIFNFCHLIMLKGVPDWLDGILACISVVCLTVALIIWEETNSRIRSLEKRLDKRNGGE